MSPNSLRRLLRFLVVGIPAFAIAVPLNWLLVDSLSWPKPAAYALVILIQVCINFVLCIRFVFERDTTKPIATQFLTFSSGILVARLLDWSLYTLLTHYTTIHFLLLQLFNVALFSVLKFCFARRTLEGPALKSTHCP